MNQNRKENAMAVPAVSMDDSYVGEAQGILRQCIKEAKTEMAVSNRISLVIQDEDDLAPQGAINVVPVPPDLAEELKGKVVFLVSNGHDDEEADDAT